MLSPDGIDTKPTTVQYGTFQGYMALSLSFTAAADPEAVQRKVKLGLLPGHRVLMLEDVPYGSDMLDEVLLRLDSDDRMEEVRIMAVRSVSAELWASVPIHWIADCSEFTAVAMPFQALAKMFVELPMRPEVAEVFVANPDRMALEATILEEIYARMGPEFSGWIYCDADGIDGAQKAAAQTAAPWGVRCLI